MGLLKRDYVYYATWNINIMIFFCFANFFSIFKN